MIIKDKKESKKIVREIEPPFFNREDVEKKS